MKIGGPACSDVPLGKEVESLQDLPHSPGDIKLKTVSGPHLHATHYIIELKDRIISHSHIKKNGVPFT